MVKVSLHPQKGPEDVSLRFMGEAPACGAPTPVRRAMKTLVIPPWTSSAGFGVWLQREVKGQTVAELKQNFCRSIRALPMSTGGCFVVTSRLREDVFLPWILP